MKRAQLWYAPLLAAAMGLMLARVVLMARLLEVPAFAAYSAALLVSTSLSMLGALGLQQVQQRDLPVLYLRGLGRRAAVLTAQCAWIAGLCFFVACLLPVVGLSVAGLESSALLVALLHGLSHQLFLVATVESRSRAEPLRFARHSLARAVGMLGAGAAAALLGGEPVAVLLAELAVSLALALSLLRRQLASRALGAKGIATLALWRLRRIDWPPSLTLLAVTLTGFAAFNVDRWAAAQVLPPTAFAHYAFAWTLLLVAQAVQALVSASFFPMLARCHAVAGQAAVLCRSALASGATLVVAATLAWPLCAGLDAAVLQWFPRYSEARPLIPWLIAVAALRLSDFWTSFLLIAGRESLLLVLHLASGVVAAAAWWVLETPGERATGLALARLALWVAALHYVGISGAAAWVGWRSSLARG